MTTRFCRRSHRRLSKTKALEAALERLQAAREDFAQAFAGILSQIDLRPIAQALADWRQAAEAFREEAQRVHGDASTYYDDRSEQWQDSGKGQAFYLWVTALEELADSPFGDTELPRNLP